MSYETNLDGDEIIVREMCALQFTDYIIETKHNNSSFSYYRLNARMLQ